MAIRLSRKKRSEYFNKYNSQIKPIFQDLEIERAKIFNRIVITSVLIFLIILSVIMTMLYRIKDDYVFAIAFYVWMIFLPAFIVSLFALWIMYKENKKFVYILKARTLQTLLSVFGKIQWFGNDKDKINNNNEILTNDEINRSGLFISYNQRITDDEFQGTYNDVTFKISETRMHDVHGSGKYRRSICAFAGVILSFKVNKNVRNRTIVSTKGDLTKKSQAYISTFFVMLALMDLFRYGFSYIKLSIIIVVIAIIAFIFFKMQEKKEEPLNEVFLEDPKFSKRFNVYSSDQVEARYLVTTAFMERFYNLQTAFGAKNVKCSFYGDTLMIAISTRKDLFEIGNLYHSLNNPNTINNLYQEVTSIFNMIEYFKLDKRIGL